MVLNSEQKLSYIKTMNIKKLVVGIHDLNPWGGQERSNLEILYRLNSHFPIELHSYTFSDSRQWPDIKQVPYSEKWANPILLKMQHYHAQSFFQLKKRYTRLMNLKRSGIVIQSTGTAFPYSNVTQVQFIHKAWEEINSKLDSNLCPSTPLIRKVYDRAFAATNHIHERLIYTNNKKYVAISHSVKKDLMRIYNIHKDNISVIYHGINRDEFVSRFDESSRFARKQIRHEHNISDDTFVLLTVGALNIRKGIHIIIDTLRELIKNGIDNVVVLAVGAGDTTFLTSKLNDLALTPFVRFVPSQKNISQYYQASDVFFFPTLYEPFGLVILEAMASGLAVVTSSVSGAAELITPGRDGIIIDPFGPSQEIASEIALLVKDQNKVRSLGERAREATLDWHWDGVANQYLEFYKAL